MTGFRAEMEARDASVGCFRAYRIEAGIDLLGAWIVDVSYGRIGSAGRTIRYVAETEKEAKRLVRRYLRRRASAPRRIGVAYQMRSLVDPGQWLDS